MLVGGNNSAANHEGVTEHMLLPKNLTMVRLIGVQVWRISMPFRWLPLTVLTFISSIFAGATDAASPEAKAAATEVRLNDAERLIFTNGIIPLLFFPAKVPDDAIPASGNVPTSYRLNLQSVPTTGCDDSLLGGGNRRFDCGHRERLRTHFARKTGSAPL
jgi:hypothetical protein